MRGEGISAKSHVSFLLQMACEGCCDRRQVQFWNVMLLRGQGLLWLSKGCTVAGPSATQKANSCLLNLSSWPIALPRTRLAVSLPPKPWCSRAVVVLSGCNKFKTYQTSLFTIAISDCTHRVHQAHSVKSVPNAICSHGLPEHCAFHCGRDHRCTRV